MTLRALIVDDEAVARRRIRRLLQREPDVTVVAEAADGRTAVQVIREQSPDVVFLDVQMPELDGFGVVAELGHHPPTIVFVTAYDEYALRAFEVHALDYLLKPFDKTRFAAALERGKAQVRLGQSGGMEQRLMAFLRTVEDHRPSPRQPLPERLVVKSAGRVSFVRVEELDWIEAAGNYVRLHVAKEDHLLRETLSGLEAKLDPRRFVRIHRSTIVNIDRIRQLQPAFHGDYVVQLHDGTELTLSRSCRDKLEEALGHAL
jgi:two-component system, LytTR family, response regulator